MDEQSTVVNDEVIETPVEETTPQETTPEVESQSEADTDSQEEQHINNSDQGEHQEKKSRLDRRIEQLADKKSGIDQTLERLKGVKAQAEQLPGKAQTPKPLISQEDVDRGEIDPQEVERRRQADWQTVKDEAKRETIQQIQYVNTVNEHLLSSERIRNKPEFQSDVFSKAFEKQYELANTVYNPITGEHQFVPRQTPEEVYSHLKTLVDDQVTKATSQVSKELSKQSSERPLDPSTQSKNENYSVDELEKMLWEDPEKVSQIIDKKYAK